MQQVGDCMVALDGRAVSGINGQLGGGTLLRHVVALDEMQKGVAGFLGVRNLPLLVADSERARVAHLAAHFGVKRCAIKHNTGALLFLNHFKDGGLGGQLIKPNELRLCTGADTRDANHFLFLRCPRPFPLLFHEDFESGGIHAQAGLAGHQFGEIEREAVCVVEFEGKFAGEFLALQLGGFFVEHLDPVIKCPVEGFFLCANGLLN